MALSPRRATGTQRSSHTNLPGTGVRVRGRRVKKNRQKGRGKAQAKPEMLLKLELQSNPEALFLVRATVERAAEVLHFQEAEARAIVRSVDEALANVLRHAYGGRPGLPIEMSCRKLQLGGENAAHGGIEILLADKGAPLKPATLKSRPLDEMQPEASGADFVQRTALKRRGFQGRSLIRQQDFDSPVGCVLAAKLQLAAAHFNGESRPSAVSVAQYVGQRFIHRADDGARLGLLKVQHFGGPLNGGAHKAQRFRIALQLQFQKHFGLCLGLSAPLLPVFFHPSTAHSYTRPWKIGVGTPLGPGCPAGRQCHVPSPLTTEKFLLPAAIFSLLSSL